MGGKFGLGGKGKTKNSNVYDSLKVMRSNPGYLLKSFLLRKQHCTLLQENSVLYAHFFYNFFVQIKANKSILKIIKM